VDLTPTFPIFFIIYWSIPDDLFEPYTLGYRLMSDSTLILFINDKFHFRYFLPCIWKSTSWLTNFKV